MPTPSRRWKWWLAAVALVAVSANLPATRKVAVNTIVSDQRLPLWIKAVDFIDRDLNFDRLADTTLGSIEDDEARAMAAFAWTRTNVRPKPPVLPSIDDHVWHIVVRGYGEADQQADVFTTLLSYAGVRAYWTLIGTAPKELPVSYVMLSGEWRVFDVAHGLVFRRADGALATPSDIASQPQIVETTASGLVADVDAYVAYFRNYRVPEVPDVLRADLQMPARRLVHELRSLVGLERRVWTIRPRAAAEGASQ